MNHPASHLERLTPLRVAIAGVLVYAALLLIAPVNITVSQTLMPYVYLALGFASFAMGCILGQVSPPQVPEDDDAERQTLSDEALQRFHGRLLLVASAGALLRLIDIFFVRDVTLQGTVLDRRAQLESVGSNPISIVAALLLPACLLVPVTYKLLRRRGLTSRFQLVFCHLLWGLPALVGGIVTGSRSQMLIYLSTYLLFSFVIDGLRLRLKTVAWVSAVGIALTAISTAIFNSRLEAMNLRPLDSVYNSAYAFTLQPKAWAVQAMDRLGGVISSTIFSLLVFFQYYLHGLFEFVYQYQNAPPTLIYGAASFNGFYKFIAIIFGLTGPEDLFASVTVHLGVYTSFFGPLYSDFGWYGHIYLAALGLLAQRLWFRCREGHFDGLPFYLYLVVVIFFFPVVNFIVSSFGVYNLIACGIFWLSFPKQEIAAGRAPHLSEAFRGMARSRLS